VAQDSVKSSSSIPGDTTTTPFGGTVQHDRNHHPEPECIISACLNCPYFDQLLENLASADRQAAATSASGTSLMSATWPKWQCRGAIQN
jgi:hypothetical protein